MVGGAGVLFGAGPGARSASKSWTRKGVALGRDLTYLKGRLDLTVEAMIVENKRWHELFTADELGKARDRLVSYRYKIRHV